MSNRFTDRAQLVILLAQEEAKRLGHATVEPVHLLLGVLGLGEGVGCQAMASHGVSIKNLRLEVERSVAKGQANLLLAQMPFSLEAKRVLTLAVEEAQAFHHNFVGTEHLLLGLLRVDASARILKNAGLASDTYRRFVLELLGEGPKPRAVPPTVAAFLRCDVFSIILRPRVSGMLITHKPTPAEPDRNVVLILVEEGTNVESIHGELTVLIAGLEQLNVEYKLPGRKPLMWVDGKWQDDDSIDKTLTY